MRELAQCGSDLSGLHHGYLTFLREYRRQHSDLGPREMIVNASIAWKCLNSDDTIDDFLNGDYFELTDCGGKKKMSSKHSKKRVSKTKHNKRGGAKLKKNKLKKAKRSRKSKKKLAASRNKCSQKSKGRRKMRHGAGRKNPKIALPRVTTAAYLNFMRYYRGRHSNLQPNDQIWKGVKAWCRLSMNKKRDFHLTGRKKGTTVGRGQCGKSKPKTTKRRGKRSKAKGRRTREAKPKGKPRRACRKCKR